MSLRFNIEEGDLEALGRQGGEAVLCTRVAADLLTPLAAFLKVADLDGHSFLLESVAGGTALARYSFLGTGPARILRIQDGCLTIQEGAKAPQKVHGDPLQALRQAHRQRRPVPQEGLPPFTGGMVGFFSYDFVRLLENLPEQTTDSERVPQALLADYRTILAFDHVRNHLLLITAVDVSGHGEQRKQELCAARERLEGMAAQLARPLATPLDDDRAGDDAPVCGVPDEDAFQRQVVQAKEAIAAGEVFQVVLSRRFSTPWQGSPVPVYRRLRSRNPSPYHFLVAADGDCLVGASPEMFVRIQDRQVQVRPIAGTRRRGRDADEDDALAGELRADDKEMAEHVMLVDLARNDVGRISEPGSIQVRQFAQVERYSHVMHMVSQVEGRLAEGCDALDAFKACFPAGTLTGAPKIRAMELIESSEPFRRGPYGGAVAYWDRGGDLDSCIAIRTVVLSGGQAHVQAGAGIVADSQPLGETREVAAKSAAGLAALSGRVEEEG